MASVGMNTDIAALIDATVAGNTDQITGIARELIERGAGASELIGRIGVIAARGDGAESDGHTILALAAASAMCRWFQALQYQLGEDPADHRRELPLLVQSLAAAIPAVRAGNAAQVSDPEPLFPGELPEGQTVGTMMYQAISDGDALLVERLLLGLHGTGADYRTLHIRLFDGIATTFQQGGHPLMCAVRGFQLLDAVEWGKRAPSIVHWLAPRIPIKATEPVWVQTVRDFLSEPAHSFASYRTRLAAPKEEQALPLRRLLLSEAGTLEICQAVFNAVMKGGASSHGVSSVIALAATDLLQRVGDEDRGAFVAAAHGLLYAAAARLVYVQVQEVEALPLLLTAACAVNALHKDLAAQQQGSEGAEKTQKGPGAPVRSHILGGGLIAPGLLESLGEQLDAQDLAGAYATARRYLQLGHDARALFAIIARAAAQTDAAADGGHTLQIVQACGESYLAWPTALRSTSIDGFLHAALRAAAFAQRNTLAANL
jgi:hypothetical protein